MIDFSHVKYELFPMGLINSKVDGKTPTLEALPRKGALIRCEWPDQRVGFADCHPWTEYGDFNIEKQLYDLSQGHMSALMEQTIWLARRDALVRSKHKSAFVGGAKVKNHFLVHDIGAVTERNLTECRDSGFSTLKIKVGRNYEQESQDLIRVLKLSQFQVRLDFNSGGDFSILERFIGLLGPAFKRRIEFVEDPFPYDESAWIEANKLVPLAVDFEYENVDWSKFTQQKPVQLPFKIIIIKPARMDVDQAIHRCTTLGLKAVVTSSMDHPVGVAHAALVATDLKRAKPSILLECGCLTLKTYRPNEFTNKILVQGPYLTSTLGTGIGFDDLLNEMDWQPVDREL